ncbi:cytochrome P450 [Aquihabitans sp. G128]|uniref:cytochrome P450 n=1 Tax=Aquihabitans sp. G128 TaxID=2849779 RepID=UPI001C227D0F|nr:cytochrome P450 [Aquihabitans sp. G128]QXC61916.1 cytochrome P450 [Aquihabitans sp. G128]
MTAVDTSTPLVYDPYAYEIHEDPYPTYARMRAEAPLYRNEERGFWALSRHGDVLAAFRDNERFSNAEGVSIDPAASGPHAHKTMSFLAMDAPQHPRMRGLVSRGFTPRRVAGMEENIRALTVRHLEAALAEGDFDFVADLAGIVPMDVISELLGVPEADRAMLRRQSDLLIHREEGVTDVPPAGVEAAFALVIYYADLIADRRAHPGDDLVSALCAAEVDGDRLTDDEITSFLFLMVVAGNETTTKLLAHAWYWAAQNPAERAKVWDDPARIPDWVEETLRYDTSSQMLARVTLGDVEYYGQTIPEGDRVLLLAGSANRDERAFADPDRFDLDRDRESVGIASFGVGRHFCLGASLARMEARIVLEELVARVSAYEIDPAGTKRVHSVNVRGFETLPTSVTRR